MSNEEQQGYGLKKVVNLELFFILAKGLITLWSSLQKRYQVNKS